MGRPNSSVGGGSSRSPGSAGEVLMRPIRVKEMERDAEKLGLVA
jgi:hypothetical protein